ncbi:MAG: hypothetical protein LAT67_15010 [Balneolales bacterium]|nr:hypothetical protein [Balneolales bacterium]
MLVIYEADGTVYLPLMGGIPGQTVFNFTTDLFAEEARIIALMDKQTGEVMEIKGRYPPAYRNNSGPRAFPFFFYDVKPNGNFIFSFAGDPLLHVLDEDFKQVRSFGVPGDGMNMDYRPIPQNLEDRDFAEWIMDQSEEFDFYTSLKYFPESALLLRGYILNDNADYDGMQVYRDGVLIADFNVPAGFRIAGYSNSVYYSEVVPDFDTLTKKIYTFTLK